MFPHDQSRERAGEKEPRQHEKHVHRHERATPRGEPCVEAHDKQHGETAQSFKVGAPEGRGGQGGGHQDKLRSGSRDGFTRPLSTGDPIMDLFG